MSRSPSTTCDCTGLRCEQPVAWVGRSGGTVRRVCTDHKSYVDAGMQVISQPPFDWLPLGEPVATCEGEVHRNATAIPLPKDGVVTFVCACGQAEFTAAIPDGPITVTWRVTEVSA